MFSQEWSHDTSTVYGYALADLNDDGRREAIVWISARNICGTGGCKLAVFRKNKAGWKLLSSTAITRPPIRVLSSKTNGWHDIGVIEAGGGVREPYEGRLRFSGKNYGVGWTGLKVPRGTKGRVAITDATLLLFPAKCRKTREVSGSVFGPIRAHDGTTGSC